MLFDEKYERAQSSTLSQATRVASTSRKFLAYNKYKLHHLKCQRFSTSPLRDSLDIYDQPGH